MIELTRTPLLTCITGSSGVAHTPSNLLHGYHHSWNGLMLGCDILQVTNHTQDLSLLEICERKLRWGEPCMQKDNNIVLLSITCGVMITNMILDLIVYAVRHTLL